MNMDLELSIVLPRSREEVLQEIASPDSGLANAMPATFDHRSPRRSEVLTAIAVTASLTSIVKFSHWVYKLLQDRKRKTGSSVKPTVTIILNGTQLEISSEAEIEIRTKLEEAARD